MDKKEFRKLLIGWIIFSLVTILVTLILIFYFDLANGPLFLFIISMVSVVGLVLARVILRKKKFLIRNSPWGVFIVITAVLIAFAHPYEQRKPAVLTDTFTTTDVLHLESGDVVGAYTPDEQVEVYAGIPYAKPPVGDLRWKAPVPIGKWEGVKDCTYFAPKSMQPQDSAIISSLVDIYSEKGWHPNYNMRPNEYRSEDSLYLNIWRPAKITSKLPILVYIHGGSLTTGSSSFEDYNGETFARNGVITITIAYRLGVFGYFAHPSLMEESGTTGNYGLLDQIEALKWINANADSFGGDASNITIAGESAGSSSVSALCVSEMAKGLFKNAIGESSSLVVKRPPHTFRKLSQAYETGENILKEYRVNNVNELRKVKATDLVKTKYSNDCMTIDGYALKEYPYETYEKGLSNEEALLNGYNVLEADAFVIPTNLLNPTNKNNIKERLLPVFKEETTNEILNLYKDKIEQDAFSVHNEIMSIYWFIYPHHVWSNMANQSSKRVYRYQFTKENGYRSSYHSGELIYAYGNIEKSNYRFAYNDSDIALSNAMVKYWTNFAKTGNPNGEGLVTWNPYTSENHNVMELGANIREFSDQYLEMFKILDKFVETLE